MSGQEKELKFTFTVGNRHGRFRQKKDKKKHKHTFLVT